MNQLDRQVAAGSPARWVAFDEVYGRSAPLRNKAAEHGLVLSVALDEEGGGRWRR
jgi:SRSO17 transposase